MDADGEVAAALELAAVAQQGVAQLGRAGGEVVVEGLARDICVPVAEAEVVAYQPARLAQGVAREGEEGGVGIEWRELD